MIHVSFYLKGYIPLLIFEQMIYTCFLKRGKHNAQQERGTITITCRKITDRK